VGSAEDRGVAQAVFVARVQLFVALHALEAVQVIDEIACAHHELMRWYCHAAAVTFTGITFVVIIFTKNMTVFGET